MALFHVVKLKPFSLMHYVYCSLLAVIDRHRGGGRPGGKCSPAADSSQSPTAATDRMQQQPPRPNRFQNPKALLNLLQNKRILDLLILGKEQNLRDDLRGFRVFVHKGQKQLSPVLRVNRKDIDHRPAL